MAAQPTSPPKPGTSLPQPGTSLPVHRIDVDTYNQIVGTGVLDDLRVELLEGLIIDMSPPSPQHSAVIVRLTYHLISASHASLRVQLPFEIRPDSVPQPDLALTAEPTSTKHHPNTALLAVEVSVSSHMIDRNIKTKHYARAGIPTYWLIDVLGRAIEVRTEPDSDGYAQCQIYVEGEAVPSPVAGVADLCVAALFADDSA